MLRLSLADVENLSRRGNVVPVHKEILGDLFTPAAAFLRVAHGRRRVFLLESVEGGDRIARYSFIGWDPFLTIRGRGEEVRLEERGEAEIRRGAPFEILKEIAGRYSAAEVEDLPPFVGGAVGYFGYECGRTAALPLQRSPDDLDLDDFELMYFSSILAFDHLKHKIHIISNILTDGGRQSLAARYQDAQLRIEQIEKRLAAPVALPMPEAGEVIPHPVSCLSQESYGEMVDRARGYLRAGELRQLLLSQRFSLAVRCEPFDLYRALRFINPAPYMYFLRMENLCLAGASPEQLVKVYRGRVESGPVAGTRPRGRTALEDDSMARQLLDDERERRAHREFVDLAQEDLGEVCEPDSVRVAELMKVEKYSHVMHLVSRLEGILRPDMNRFDALRSCLPAGTVSGVPKHRAREVIEELEPGPRGVYAGAVGYLDFSGNMDTCIALRTLVVKDGMAQVQAGSRIFGDRTAESASNESAHKARALLQAVEFAHRGLR